MTTLPYRLIVMFSLIAVIAAFATPAEGARSGGRDTFTTTDDKPVVTAY